MKKCGVDLLFLFAVVAGVIYELIYEPIRGLISYGVHCIIRAVEIAWRRCRGMAAEAPSRPA
ncbi:MAG: hypothetical protein MUP21_14235 [Dehalococcoidia bacterium]|nr:hypothetical protein [Dehalococcoidia bacterium]